MKTPQFQSMALRALNVDRDEFHLVRALFFHHFFQGFGIALLTIIAIKEFLYEFAAAHLPIVYMVTALVLLGIGRVYAILEHRVPLRKLFPLIALVIALLAAAGWIGLLVAHADSLYKTALAGGLIFSLMVLYRVVYLLGSLEFWGLSAIVFDVRQSKRLFALISAGFVPAKLLGYLLVGVVSWVAPKNATDHLLLVAGISFFISFFLLHRAMRRADLREPPDSGGHTHGQSTGIVARIFGTRFVVALAALSFVTILVLTTIDYAFLAELKKKFEGTDDLAVFLSLFFAVSSTVTIIAEIFLSSRLVDRIGVRGSLLFLPVALLLICLALIVEEWVWTFEYAEFWFFGIMILTCDVLVYALNSPVFLAMFQPLDRHRRLQGHTVVKGLTDPISLGLAGVVLFAITRMVDEKGILSWLAWLIAGLVIIWILTIVIVNRRYLEMLKHAIYNRFLAGSQLEFTDRQSLAILRDKLASDYPEEVIYALELLRKAQPESFSSMLIALLDHENDEVVIHALGLVEELELHDARGRLTGLMEQRETGPVARAAARAWCRLAPDELDVVMPFLDSSDADLHSGAVEGLMFYGGVEGIVAGGQELLSMIAADDEPQRIQAARTIGNLGIERLHRPIEQLLDDSSVHVQREAIRAAGLVRNPKLLPRLFDFLDNQSLRCDAVDALPAFDDRAVQEMQQRFDSSHDLTPGKRRDLIEICRRIGSDDALRLLVLWCDNESAGVRDLCYTALHVNHFHAGDASAWTTRLESALQDARTVLQAIRMADTDTRLEQVARALREELHAARQRLLLLIGFLYDRQVVAETRRELESENRERHANALETLDNLLPNQITDRLFAIIDADSPGQSTQRTELAAASGFLTADDLIDHLLEEGEGKYTTWTLATAIDAVGQLRHERLVLAIHPYASHCEQLLAETAIHVMRQVHGDMPPHVQTKLDEVRENVMTSHSDSGSKLLEIEKVIILKTSPLFAET
ncbi:MAG: HEAT repeat domain-containing protein, partial [Pirellulaceae bacterium]